MGELTKLTTKIFEDFTHSSKKEPRLYSRWDSFISRIRYQGIGKIIDAATQDQACILRMPKTLALATWSRFSAVPSQLPSFQENCRHGTWKLGFLEVIDATWVNGGVLEAKEPPLSAGKILSLTTLTQFFCHDFFEAQRILLDYHLLQNPSIFWGNPKPFIFEKRSGAMFPQFDPAKAAFLQRCLV